MLKSAGTVTDSQTFNNPTFTGVQDQSGVTRLIGAPRTLSQSAIPFIHLSSGSVAANGAISGITALPNAFAHAYCYFPANILATSIAADWYYCTFSTTTAGTAFLNTYVTGSAPTIPGSPTAVTDGKGAFTGDTSERLGPSITLAAGAMGPNGTLEILIHDSSNNTAGSKRSRVRIGGIAGTLHGLLELANNLGGDQLVTISNRGIQSRQRGTNSVTTYPGVGLSASALNYGTDDLSIASTVAITLIKATATDNMVLEGYSIRVEYGA